MIHELDREHAAAPRLWDYASRHAALRALGLEGFVRAVLRQGSCGTERGREPARRERRGLEAVHAQEGGGGA